MKVVAVQRGLEHIKNQLNLLGYETLFFDEMTFPVDAIIYFQGHDNNTLININRQLSSTYMIQREFSNNTSSILINANDKSIYDIVQIIESRLYSPLL
jgi:hypothetical protein